MSWELAEVPVKLAAPSCWQPLYALTSRSVFEHFAKGGDPRVMCALVFQLCESESCDEQFWAGLRLAATGISS
jgi:hypothetical protein